MKKSCASLKGEAREIMLGNYSIMICAVVLTWLITGLCSMPFENMLQQGLEFNVMSRTLIGVVGVLLVSLVSVLFGAGISKMHLMLSRNRKVLLKDLFYAFQYRPDRYLGFGLFMILIGAGCSIPGIICLDQAVPTIINSSTSISFSLGLIVGVLLLLIGAIIMVLLTLAYSQTIFLMLDDPQITVSAAMSQSMRLMRGNKWRLFRLLFSFIGLFLLSVLTLGIGLLWIVPYVDQSSVQFYLDLMPSAGENGEEA